VRGEEVNGGAVLGDDVLVTHGGFIGFGGRPGRRVFGSRFGKVEFNCFVWMEISDEQV